MEICMVEKQVKNNRYKTVNQFTQQLGLELQ